jgi:hypothetical protein
VTVEDFTKEERRDELPNGAAAAALLAAGAGSFLLAVLALIADKAAAIKSWMIFYRPTGPLSGVTTTAIVLWLLIWFLLHALWQKKGVSIRPVIVFAFTLLGLAIALTFPPIADLF